MNPGADQARELIAAFGGSDLAAIVANIEAAILGARDHSPRGLAAVVISARQSSTLALLQHGAGIPLRVDLGTLRTCCATAYAVACEGEAQARDYLQHCYPQQCN